MSYDIAFVREQGMNFVVACMENHVLSSTHESREVCAALSAEHGVASAIVDQGFERIYGDKRLLPWLQSVDLRRLPWRRVF